MTAAVAAERFDRLWLRNTVGRRASSTSPHPDRESNNWADMPTCNAFDALIWDTVVQSDELLPLLLLLLRRRLPVDAIAADSVAVRQRSLTAGCLAVALDSGMLLNHHLL